MLSLCQLYSGYFNLFLTECFVLRLWMTNTKEILNFKFKSVPKAVAQMYLFIYFFSYAQLLKTCNMVCVPSHITSLDNLLTLIKIGLHWDTYYLWNLKHFQIKFCIFVKVWAFQIHFSMNGGTQVRTATWHSWLKITLRWWGPAQSILTSKKHRNGSSF